MALIHRTDDGGTMPALYGIAWWRTEWSKRTAVCLPVPLNLLARMLRDFWLYLRYQGGVPVNPRAAFAEGYRAGRTAHLATMDDTDYLLYADRPVRERNPKCN